MRFILTLIAVTLTFSCVSSSHPPCDQSGSPVISVSFNELGWMVGGPRNGDFIVHQWNITVGNYGCALINVKTDGKSIPTSYQSLKPAQLETLVTDLLKYLNGLPQDIGRDATDSDYGEIQILWKNQIRLVRLHGGGSDAPRNEVNQFYRVIRKLKSKFPVSLN